MRDSAGIDATVEENQKGLRRGSMSKKANPYCPVTGCNTRRPHMDDPLVQGLHREFSPPQKLAFWTRAAIGELINSVQSDLSDNRVLAYVSRWRQLEELYYRALYVIFIAKDVELPHIFSGEMPNGFAAIYRAVNRDILAG